MKKLLTLCLAMLLASAAFAQDELPTVNWPYIYPDFVEGEITQIGGKSGKAVYNIHLGQGALHFVKDGLIALDGAVSLTKKVNCIVIED
jgi:hypothetical protein